jgi:hypothetical protein
VVIDPRRHEHAARRAGEKQSDEYERIGTAVDQPPRGERQREEQEKQRQHRRDCDGGALGLRSADERPKRKDNCGDGQIDEPRPMDVGAIGRVQPVLAKVEPVLAREQRTNLAHPQIVVGVAKREETDPVPALDDEVEAKGYPDADHYPFPVAVDEIENAIQALPRFNGFPAVAARGYRASGLPPCFPPFTQTAADCLASLPAS